MSRFFNNIFLYATFLLIGSCANASKPTNDEVYYIVNGVSKLNKREDLSSNVMPWKIDAAAEESEFDEVITFSHGCTFYDIEYFLDGTLKSRKVLPVRVQPGEFCDLRNLVFAHPTLVKIKRWEGINYYLGSAPIIFDQEERGYISGVDIPDDWNLDRLLVNYPVSSSSPFCTSKKSLSQRKFNYMMSSGYVAELDEEVCHSYVLPLTKIKEIENSSFLKKSGS